MLKKYLSLFLAGFLFSGVSPQIILAQSNTDNSDERNRVERIKTNIYRLDNGGNSKIAVRLQSGAKLKGYITKIGEDSFDLTNYKTKKTTAIAYRDVAQVKPRGGSSKAGKYALGVGTAAAIIALVAILPRRRGPSTICPLGCR